MQRKQRREAPNIMRTILSSMPPESGFTTVEYEGPRIALYTKSPRYLLEHNEVISGIANSIRKRIVLRTDKSVRKPEEQVRKDMAAAVPADAGLQSLFFDAATGEVSLEAKRPWLLQRKSPGFSRTDLAEKTGWLIRVRKAPTSQSSTMQSINYNLRVSAAERTKHLKQMGDQIFRPRMSQRTDVVLHSLGGFGQVGRSCMLLSTPESKILLDCGVNPGARHPSDAFPRLDSVNITLDDLDAVVIGHAHLDHSGFLPVLCKYGYRGPIYCTEPTLPMMNLIQLDAIKVSVHSS